MSGGSFPIIFFLIRLLDYVIGVVSTSTDYSVLIVCVKIIIFRMDSWSILFLFAPSVLTLFPVQGDRHASGLMDYSDLFLDACYHALLWFDS
jgi:hypothetical protein